jgi:hypothetical protein
MTEFEVNVLSPTVYSLAQGKLGIALAFLSAMPAPTLRSADGQLALRHDLPTAPARVSQSIAYGLKKPKERRSRSTLSATAA